LNERKARGEILVSDCHHVMNFDEFSNFRTMAQTLRSFKLLTEFSGTSRVQNLNPHDQNWDWTKRKAKRPTNIRVHIKNIKNVQKKSALLSPRFATTGGKVLLVDGTVTYKTVSTSHIDLNIARSARPVAKFWSKTATM
jgi:hypothetical protein